MPTDVAGFVYGRKFYTGPAVKVVDEETFDSATKRSGVLTDDGTWYFKGAFKNILRSCSAKCDTAAMLEACCDLAKAGKRVMAVGKSTEASGEGMELLGVIVMENPLLPEVPECFAKLTGAGIRIGVITGDCAETALAVSKSAGLDVPEKNRMTGAKMLDMHRAGTLAGCLPDFLFIQYLSHIQHLSTTPIPSVTPIYNTHTTPTLSPQVPEVRRWPLLLLRDHS